MNRSTTTEYPTPARPRTWALWWALIGILVVVVLALVTGARVAGLTLAIHLTVLGLARLVLPSPGPMGITARSKAFDVTFFWLGAAGTALMALTADNL